MSGQRFDDIMEKVANHETGHFSELVDEYNEMTSKWNFWEYAEETVKLGGLTYKDVFELACLYISQKHEN